MEQTEMTKQIIDFQKGLFDHTFASLTALQDYSENVMDGLLSQSPWIDAESKAPINASMEIVKSGREEYKKAVYQGFAELEKLVASK